jgi:hypothetical protein
MLCIEALLYSILLKDLAFVPSEIRLAQNGQERSPSLMLNQNFLGNDVPC